MTATDNQSDVDTAGTASSRLYSYDLAPTKKEGRDRKSVV